MSIDALAHAALGGPRRRSRLLIAVAGPPASGKSTFAEHLAKALCDAGARPEVVPMDGYHFDNVVLRARGLLDLKGAPQTFDAERFLTLVERLAFEDNVTYPLFDRSVDATVPDAGRVTSDTDCIVLEGNYLLLRQPIWADLAQWWDFSIFLDVPEAVLKARLVARWEAHGHTAAQALARAMQNDLPNVQTVLRESDMSGATVVTKDQGL